MDIGTLVKESVYQFTEFTNEERVNKAGETYDVSLLTKGAGNRLIFTIAD